MRMTPATVTLRDHEWEFILDCIVEHRDVAVTLNSGRENLDPMIAKANRIISEIHAKVAD